MEGIWKEVRAGWQEAQWSLYYALALVPTVALAFALAYLIEGRITTPPSPLTWVLCTPAALVSLYWAGLKSGPDSWLGRFVFAVTLVFLLVLAIRRAMRAGVTEFTFVRRIGHFTISAPVRQVSESVATGAELPPMAPGKATVERVTPPDRDAPEGWQRFRPVLRAFGLAFSAADRATWSN